jgi:TraB/PrgY/gumN family
MRALWEKKLRMVWQIERGKTKNFLVGTAHFFPHSFKKSLTQLIGKVKTVLLEGPLDEGNMDVVRKHSSERQAGMTMYAALDSQTISEINKELGGSSGYTECSLASFMALSSHKNQDLLFSTIGDLRPWMAFFRLWSQFLAKRGWKYSVDIEALTVARELGKKVVYLETIEEQLEALDGIPFERIVDYVNKFRNWGRFAGNHRRQYLKGSLDGLLNITTAFPTRCASIIDRRDPVFFERMKPYIDAGDAAVFIGTTHMRGVTKMLEEDGFKVSIYRI